MQSIQALVREAEDNYLNGTVSRSSYVDWSMHDTIETIDAYLNSKHISGATDSHGREKPFFNIVTAARNIWYKATDLDRKNIRILPDSADHTAHAFIATVLLQRWMREERFGVFLNQWGLTLANYGSAIVKFVRKDGRLIPSVVPWNRFIADPLQFDAIPRIEKFYMTPAQLRKNTNYNQKVVDELIQATSSRETLDGFKQDNKNDFIEIYEVHGELDTRLLEDEPNEEAEPKFRQQMHVISYVQKGKDYEDFTLYKGKEAQDPYMLTHLIEEDGRTLSIGSVEYLFDSQWMVNHSMKNMKDTLDISSKLIFQTADSNFVGRNVLNAIETGDIFTHKENMPLTRLANDKPDITALQNYGIMWQRNANDIVSTPEAIKGQTLPSGTPYSLGALLTQNAGNIFEQMTENKGLHLEDMMREYIIPFLKTKMDTSEEIVAVLEADQIAEVDAMYIPRQAIRNFNKRTIDTLLSGGIPSPFNPQAEEQNVRQGLGEMGNKRSFKPSDISEKTWKQSLKDFEWRAIVEITNETTDKQAVLTTLSTVFQTIASNPQILQDANAKMILGAILSETGRISPIQLSSVSAAQPNPVPNQPLQALAEKTNV